MHLFGVINWIFWPGEDSTFQSQTNPVTSLCVHRASPADCITTQQFAQTSSNAYCSDFIQPIHLQCSDVACHLQLQHLLPSVNLTSKFQRALLQNRLKQNAVCHCSLHTGTGWSVGTQTVLLCCARAKPRLSCLWRGRVPRPIGGNVSYSPPLNTGHP